MQCYEAVQQAVCHTLARRLSQVGAPIRHAACTQQFGRARRSTASHKLLHTAWCNHRSCHAFACARSLGRPSTRLASCRDFSASQNRACRLQKPAVHTHLRPCQSSGTPSVPAEHGKNCPPKSSRCKKNARLPGNDRLPAAHKQIQIVRAVAQQRRLAGMAAGPAEDTHAARCTSGVNGSEPLASRTTRSHTPAYEQPPRCTRCLQCHHKMQQPPLR
mmetsp:Transcript_30183/g.89566  ORF Transcript_30183/g.89566 Transcript_30183/m.89566 type:complete len:217 (-) Transcript_30183:1623-2273(-)